MSADRWTEVERIYHRAVECPPDQRAAMLDGECAGDVWLRSTVDRMLAGKDELTGELPDKAVAAQSMSERHLVGRYEALSMVGAGGMGQVYKGRDTRLKRSVAIKVLPTHAAHDAERRRSLLREARTVSAINHRTLSRSMTS